jgi:hypothetical protein
MQHVIVEIDEQGNVKVEAKGVQGQSCAALTKELEQALGTTTADQKKPEYFQRETASVRANANRNA